MRPQKSDQQPLLSPKLTGEQISLSNAKIAAFVLTSSIWVPFAATAAVITAPVFFAMFIRASFRKESESDLINSTTPEEKDRLDLQIEYAVTNHYNLLYKLCCNLIEDFNTLNSNSNTDIESILANIKVFEKNLIESYYYWYDSKVFSNLEQSNEFNYSKSPEQLKTSLLALKKNISNFYNNREAFTEVEKSTITRILDTVKELFSRLMVPANSSVQGNKCNLNGKQRQAYSNISKNAQTLFGPIGKKADLKQQTSNQALTRATAKAC